MFVSIDMDKLVFLHKHHDHDTISALSFLEAPDRSIMVENTAREHFLLKLSALDIRMLYRNTTGQDITGSPDIVVREMLASLVDNHMQPTLCLLTEVEQQVIAVNDDLHNGIAWKYSLGAKVPAKAIELFGKTCNPLGANEMDQAATLAPQRRAVRSAPVAPPPPAPAPSASALPKARASSVRPVIWAVADEMWEAAGSPTDKAVVLELRKKMMVELEEKKGVKKTSSSNELGNWMKARLS